MTDRERHLKEMDKLRRTTFFTNIILFLSMVMVGCLAVKWVIG